MEEGFAVSVRATFPKKTKNTARTGPEQIRGIEFALIVIKG
jgi:hypothetical protein